MIVVGAIVTLIFVALLHSSNETIKKIGAAAGILFGIFKVGNMFLYYLKTGNPNILYDLLAIRLLDPIGGIAAIFLLFAGLHYFWKKV
ncbi:Uncharacterised protein [uncultured archaeon]|nr:Uncharacterised protein [uncultured archaeon]